MPIPLPSIRFILLVSLCCFQWSCFAHRPPTPDTDLDFETTLYQFKHDLYPLLMLIESPHTRGRHELSKEVTQRLDIFLQAYGHDLRQHWIQHLQKIGRFQVDLSQYREIPLSATLTTDFVPPQVMLLRDPISQMYILISLTLVHHLQMSSSQIHAFYLRAQLAAPLFQTSLGPAGTLVILADFYTYAFAFVYEPASGHVELKHLYRRKSLK